jgi:hypothetical protein
MFLIKKDDSTPVKISIEGADRNGANVTRTILVGDANVEEIAEMIRKAINTQTLKELDERIG